MLQGSLNNCPRGHRSEDRDYCSVCGTKLGGVAMAGSTGGLGTGSTGEVCPECGIARAQQGGASCEVCGYDFVTGGHGAIPSPLQNSSKKSTSRFSSAAEPGQHELQLSADRQSSLQSADVPSTPARGVLRFRSEGDLFLCGLGGALGVLVNGECLESLTDYALKDGDEISFAGPIRLRIEAK